MKELRIAIIALFFLTALSTVLQNARINLLRSDLEALRNQSDNRTREYNNIILSLEHGIDANSRDITRNLEAIMSLDHSTAQGIRILADLKKGPQ